MAGLKHTIIRAALEALALTQVTRLARRVSKARGVIFTIHRVLPDDPADFSPNAILQIKPDFLEFVIQRTRKLGYQIVDIDEAVRRIESDVAEKPFAVFTFDDAYRDNLTYALPILRRQQCPFTLYVPTALVDGVGEVWWQALEDIIAAQTALAVTYMGDTEYLPTANVEEKRAAFDNLYQRLRRMPEADRVTLIHQLATQYGFDLSRHCRELIMDWHELRIFASEQLCTIGAHTVHHYELAKLAATDARSEMEQSIRIIKAQFGKAPVHFSYPYGGAASAGEREFQFARDLGLRSAVTTRVGGIYVRHRDHLTALPRVSLNGSFQARRYFDVLATPAVLSLKRN